MRVLLIDHYDSFTYNLVHLVGELTGAPPDVLQHDDPRLEAADWTKWDAVILSPGPGTPERAADARFSREALLPGRPPVLGVCLGMQLIAHEAGARVARAPTPMHGRSSRITHDGSGLFVGVPSPVDVVRYHSLACQDLPTCLRPTAFAPDGVIMALEHRSLPQWGVQFHPESIATEHGRTVVENFLRMAGGWSRRAPPPTRPRPLEQAPILHTTIPFAVDTERLFAAVYGASGSAVWLDGAATREGTRFSLLGDASGPLACTLTYRSRERRLTVRGPGEREEVLQQGLFPFLRERLGRPAPQVPGLPFALGFCGYLGYELRAECGSPVEHPSALPDAELVYLDRAVVVDHQEGRTHLLALPDPENEKWQAEMAEQVRAVGPHLAPGEARGVTGGQPTWRDDADRYREKVVAAQEHLAAGDSYELCLTNRVELPVTEDPFVVYQRLRRVNPAPYAAFLRFPGVAILSSSPELFLKLEGDGRVTAKPIKGTRRRDPSRDPAIAEALRTSTKDRSENLMIVDLLRNDLGRVCELGSVEVPSLFAVESFATVHQLVSTITGRLRPELGAVDLIEASFPPGSMTGAPKTRSMALLEALEAGPRGPYAGAIGFLSRCGAAELSVVIRTIVMAEGVASVGVGGAVVTLSDPDDEVAEMRLKAEPLLRALTDDPERDGGLGAVETIRRLRERYGLSLSEAKAAWVRATEGRTLEALQEDLVAPLQAVIGEQDPDR